jgi:ubiquinone/menaquinone biosynthesis C-methylase UbiE
MTDTARFWDSICPHLADLEGVFGVDTESTVQLARFMRSPVLIVGAGQGLLVEALRQEGFRVEGVDRSPQMVAYAEKRRGIKLVHADASDMPFQDNQFMTTIVATGVIDFMDDTDQVRAIIDEVGRVTDDSGDILVAFYGFSSPDEALWRYTGLLSDSQFRLRRFCQLAFTPKEFTASIRKDPNIGKIGLILRLIKSYMSLRRRTKERLKELRRKMKRGELDPEILSASFPEQVPYRDEEQIRGLFKSLDIPLRNTFVFNCATFVQI